MEKVDVYRTNMVLALALFVVYYFYPSPYVGGAGVGILILTLIVPTAGEWLARGWMKFAEVLGSFNAKLILVLLYYLVLTPWSWVVRVVRHDPLKLERPEDGTTFEDRDGEFTRDDFERVS